LLVVLFGCETWSLTLREEHTPRVVESRVLRGVFRLERDEVAGELRKLHNKELNGRYCSPTLVRVIKSRRMRRAGHVARMGLEERRIQGFDGETRGKRPLGDPDVDGTIMFRSSESGIWGYGLDRAGSG